MSSPSCAIRAGRVGISLCWSTVESVLHLCCIGVDGLDRPSQCASVGSNHRTPSTSHPSPCPSPSLSLPSLLSISPPSSQCTTQLDSSIPKTPSPDISTSQTQHTQHPPSSHTRPTVAHQDATQLHKSVRHACTRVPISFPAHPSYHESFERGAGGRGTNLNIPDAHLAVIRSSSEVRTETRGETERIDEIDMSGESIETGSGICVP